MPVISPSTLTFVVEQEAKTLRLWFVSLVLYLIQSLKPSDCLQVDYFEPLNCWHGGEVAVWKNRIRCSLWVCSWAYVGICFIYCQTYGQGRNVNGKRKNVNAVCVCVCLCGAHKCVISHLTVCFCIFMSLNERKMEESCVCVHGFITPSITHYHSFQEVLHRISFYRSWIQKTCCPLPVNILLAAFSALWLARVILWPFVAQGVPGWGSRLPLITANHRE